MRTAGTFFPLLVGSSFMGQADMVGVPQRVSVVGLYPDLVHLEN